MSFLSLCPSAGHVAKAKMVISIKARPAASHSRPVDSLQEAPTRLELAHVWPHALPDVSQGNEATVPSERLLRLH